ncbi:hypothetical protein Tco_1547381 [Tanacetum coccineum]
MSTSKTYQQSLADAGSETRPPMLERGSYIPWASRFRRYINRKRENRKWLNKALDEGPYQFEMFIPNNSTVPKLQTAKDLQGDALLHYDAEMELMNLILLSIPNDIYNSVDACTSAKDMWKRVERADIAKISRKNQANTNTRRKEYTKSRENANNGQLKSTFSQTRDFSSWEGDDVGREGTRTLIEIMLPKVNKKNSNATPSIPVSMPNNSLHAEIEQLKKKSIEIQEGLQAKIKILEKDVQRNECLLSSVRRPMNRDSHVKNSVLANSKKPTKKVAVYVRKNKQTDITSENVISNKENVIDVDVANAPKAKTLLCFVV